MKTTLSIVVTLSALTLASAAQAQNSPEAAEEQWQELPRNTTIYVPVPQQVTPVSAYRSCSNRYEGERCDFATPQQGVVEGTCEAPEMRQPPAYGYQVQQYPAQVRTGLVCTPVDTPAPGGPGSGPANPGHETPYAPPQAPMPPAEAAPQ
ncbi:hypothetical protein [Pseudomonas hunanensis]|uniref:Uncharacterized protein n=1 Tax=Pseudomonas hunanensis TaxID=1247546 RepID=A0ACC6K112_9PSED|nr:hypothetical protein [Pseudomonas hunanensis]MBP2260288.1 hypothetical protein [Pseudomonas sp. BP8]MDR6712140.1 hypothetical protein [Pseudomonas hunanensis]HDS1733908.1 hypothetical protein [Pseudomonas putida]